jgi:hypothetical protein
MEHPFHKINAVACGCDDSVDVMNLHGGDIIMKSMYGI